MKSCCKHLPCVGSALIALLFLVAGVSKLLDFSKPLEMVEGRGLPLASFVVVLAIVIELGGALMILTRWKSCIGSLMLGVYIILATLLFHMGEGQMMFVFGNLAVLGGLMLVLANSKSMHCCSDKKDKKNGCCESGGHGGCSH